MTYFAIDGPIRPEDSLLCCILLKSEHCEFLTVDRAQTKPEEGCLYLLEGAGIPAAVRRFRNGRFGPGPADIAEPRRSIWDGRRRVTGRVTISWTNKGL